MESLIHQLTPYVPAGAAPIIADWIIRTQCHFKIARKRKSKLGDYRAPYKGQGHRISVNGDLNPFTFLITTVHEFAHLLTWQEHGTTVKPHGPAWKSNFRSLMTPFFEANIFPEDIRLVIEAYLKNPAASSCGDIYLSRVLHQYDDKHVRQGYTFLENIPDGAHFKTQDGRLFQKSAKIRVRFRCREVATSRVYLFSPVAAVLPLSNKVN